MERTNRSAILELSGEGLTLDDAESVLLRAGDDAVEILLRFARHDIELRPAAGAPDQRRDIEASIRSRAGVDQEEGLQVRTSRWRSIHAAQNGISQSVRLTHAICFVFCGAGEKNCAA